ncbi:hypothetical protein EVG20_g7336 [Dentipellis fragilis]|uniref:Uncharacterized protein n=1 Tax=Dentipellis fragilis TaxID=205917 RepID=A0A4Y9YEA9_9AGAM|nr:hypothetical protein EVG20_g7336 [Dentipellis fragilis]
MIYPVRCVSEMCARTCEGEGALDAIASSSADGDGRAEIEMDAEVEADLRLDNVNTSTRQHSILGAQSIPARAHYDLEYFESHVVARHWIASDRLGLGNRTSANRPHTSATITVCICICISISISVQLVAHSFMHNAHVPWTRLVAFESGLLADTLWRRHAHRHHDAGAAARLVRYTTKSLKPHGLLALGTLVIAAAIATPGHDRMREMRDEDVPSKTMLHEDADMDMDMDMDTIRVSPPRSTPTST